MKHRQCTLSDLEIDMHEVFLLMGYKGAVPENDILSLIDKVYSDIAYICRPRYMYEIYDAHTLDAGSIEISGKKFITERIITRYLSGMEKCCVFAATAGSEYDTYKKRLRDKGDIPEEFIADAIGSIIAEACVTRIANELAETADGSCTYPYSPGYCNWKLPEQSLLFSLLPDSPCGITLTESCLMVPIKSTSGIMGIGKNIKRKVYACHICDDKNCYKRKEI